MKRAIGIWVLGAGIWLWSCGGDGSGAGPDQDDGPPPPPANLRVEKIRDGEVWLNWKESEEGAVYVVYRSEDEGEAAAVDSTFRTDFQDRGLEYEIEYTYYITAVDVADNESLPSNTVSGQPFNNLAPLAPTGVRAFAHNIFILDQLDISLDWDANEEADLVGYRVYRSTEADFAVGTALLRIQVETPRFVDEEVEVGTVYYYRITAVDRGSKESAASPAVRDVALPLPELVAPVQGEITSSKPTFRWRPVHGARTYRVIVTTSPTSGEISAMPLTSDTTAVFAGRSLPEGGNVVLESGQLYYWKLIVSTREDGAENAVSRVESFKVR